MAAVGRLERQIRNHFDDFSDEESEVPQEARRLPTHPLSNGHINLSGGGMMGTTISSAAGLAEPQTSESADLSDVLPTRAEGHGHHDHARHHHIGSRVHPKVHFTPMHHRKRELAGTTATSYSAEIKETKERPIHQKDGTGSEFAGLPRVAERFRKGAATTTTKKSSSSDKTSHSETTVAEAPGSVITLKSGYIKQLLVRPGVSYRPRDPDGIVHIENIIAEDSDAWISMPASLENLRIASADKPAVNVKRCWIIINRCIIRTIFTGKDEKEASHTTMHLDGCRLDISNSDIECRVVGPMTSASGLTVVGDSDITATRCRGIVRSDVPGVRLTFLNVDGLTHSACLHDNFINYTTVGGNHLIFNNVNRSKGCVTSYCNVIKLNTTEEVRTSTYHHIHADDTSTSAIVSRGNTVECTLDMLGTPYWSGQLALTHGGDSAGIVSMGDVFFGPDIKRGQKSIDDYHTSAARIRTAVRDTQISPADKVIAISPQLAGPISLQLPRLDCALVNIEIVNKSNHSIVVSRIDGSTISAAGSGRIAADSFTVPPQKTAVFAPVLSSNSWQATLA